MNLFAQRRCVLWIAPLLVLSIACWDAGSRAEQAQAKTSKEAAETLGPANDGHPPNEHETDEHETDEHARRGEHGKSAGAWIELTPDARARIEIRTAPVEERVLATELSTTGQVDFDQTRLAHVSPRISGRVHRVNALLGQEVAAGQRLAELDSIELGQAKATYLQAKAKEELASKSFRRAQDLFADRIVSEQEALEAEAVMREASAGLRSAEETLHLYGLGQQQIDGLTYEDRGASLYPLRAPFAGTVVERHATLGELVTPQRNLFTLADLSKVWIWIDIYQRDLGAVHLEDQARARVDAFPNEVFEGKLSYLSARVDADTRTVRARIDVANPAGKLRPGMFVEVDLVDPHVRNGGETRNGSLAVPEGAVVRDGDAFVIFVVAGVRRFERRAIQVGRKAGGYIEILEGVGAGDDVVVEGAFLLKSVASKDSLGGGHDH